MRSNHLTPRERRNRSDTSTAGSKFASRGLVAVVVAVALSLSMVTPGSALAESQSSAATTTAQTASAPLGTVPGTKAPAQQTPTSPPVPVERVESWTPTSHSVTADGQTTLDLFAQPAFKRDADGWTAIDSTITAGTGTFPFEALGLANPVHFGVTAEALVTIDTVSGPVVFGLEGATINSPTLNKGVVTYAGVFPGVNLQFNTDGGRIGKHLILADKHAKSKFRFTITDPEHSLGKPREGAAESWTFASQVAFATGIALPAPAAWTEADKGPGLPGSAHQRVSTTQAGYAINLSVDPLWAKSAGYPLVLDPAVQWTDETWVDDNGIAVAFGPTGATDCNGGPCQLADPVDGQVKIGPQFGSDTRSFLAFVGANVSVLAGRQVSSAVLGGYEYSATPLVSALCTPIGTGSTGADLAAARCGAPVKATRTYDSPPAFGWSTDVTTSVRAAVKGTGPTGSTAGFAIDSEPYTATQISSPGLRLVYAGYPVPRPLTVGQTFGCECWAGHSSANQAMAADPVNTATGALMENFADISLPGTGQSIDLSRTYNSLNTTSGPFGPGWSFSYGASLAANTSGELVFTDGSGTRTRFGALVGGGYAPIDPAVSATLSDGPNSTRVMRNLDGDTMTFNAAGALLAAADERGQGLTFAYTAGNLTTVTDSIGQTLTFGWAGTGADARISSATTSDGRTVGYTHATTAGARRLTGVTAVNGTTTTYGYATTGGISRITDPVGHISARNTYNTAGRITSQLDQTGAMTTFGWNAATQTATVTDPTGKIRTDVYNNLNLVKQIDGNGAVIEQLYDGDNNPAALVDAANRLYRDEYDDRDRLVRRIAPAPLNYTESWTYDNADNVTSHTDADGYTTTYTYNTANLLTAVDNPDGGTSTFTYTTGSTGSPANLPATSTDPLGRTTTYSYNAAGDLVSTTTPAGRTTTSIYDSAHRLTSMTTPLGAVTSYTYDAAGRMLTSTDPVGAVTTNTYDTAGRLTKTTDALNRPAYFTYDFADRLIQTKDAAGNIDKTSYDAAGRIATTTDALGAVTTFAYDAAGRRKTTTDALGHVTTQTYDTLGQLTAVTDPTGAVTAYTYDAVRQMTSMTDADGVKQSTTYDRRGNATEVLNGVGGFQRTTYDSMGRQTYTYDSDGVETGYSYDGAGQLLEVMRPRSTDTYIPNYWADRTTFNYDVDGRRTTAVEPRGNIPGADPADFTTTLAYDADGRPTSSTDPLGRVLATTYDAVGRPTTVTDPAGGVTTSIYNLMGWTTAVASPTSAKTSYFYDSLGNLIKRIDPLSHATKYSYDSVDRVLTQTDGIDRVTEMVYDAVGNMTKLVKPSGTATTSDLTDGTALYEYDAANRVTATTFSDATAGFTYSYTAAGRPADAQRVRNSSVLASSAYTYDIAGRAISTVRTGPGGGTTNYAYTEAGRPSGTAWSTGMYAAYSYNGVGELTTVTPSGTGNLPEVNYGYDPSGRVSTVTRGGASTPITSSMLYDNAGQLSSLTHSTSSSALTAYGITRDTRGNPTKVTTTAAGATTTALYGFDTLSRLTFECYPTTSTSCTSTSKRLSYTYNNVGNRQTQAVRTGSTTVTTNYTYDNANQLLSQAVGGTSTATNTWTANGAVASATTPSGTTTYTTDLADELVSAVLENGSTLGYTHDVKGNRTSRTVGGVADATWAWDELASLPTRAGEYDSVGSLTEAWLPDPISSTGTALAETEGTTGSWLMKDPFSNVTGAIATNGSAMSGTRLLNAFGGSRSAATGRWLILGSVSRDST